MAWAVDEQRRLGKPPLDGLLLGRIGSVAKRMVREDLSIEEVKLAVETLVQRDMTDLMAAHRKAIAAPAGSSRRPSFVEMETLSASAAASSSARRRRIASGEQRNEDPHREDEIAEVAWLVAYTWNVNMGVAQRAAWSEELRSLPTSVILWSIRKLARSGEYSFAPPTWAEVERVGRSSFDDWAQRVARREATLRTEEGE